MSFQAYLNNIKSKTGKDPEDFKKLAEKKGLLREGVKAGEVTRWLKEDFGLGHGHAMAIYMVLKGSKEKKEPVEKSIAKHFSGNRSVWKLFFDELIQGIRAFGDDISLAPSASYISILRGKKKMAIVQVMVANLDIGIRLKGVAANKRFAAAGNWNAMMTHRVRITAGEEVDNDLVSWLRSAYEQNG